MWRAMKAATLGYEILDSAGLAADAGKAEGRQEAHTLPLDKVTVAGQANSLLLYRVAVALQLTAITAIMSIMMPPEVAETPEWISKLLAEPGEAPHGRIRIEYEEHFRQLLEFGLIELAKHAHVRFWSGYFAVPKKGGEARAIYNGGRMSRRCRVPPPVHLITARQLLRRMRSHLGAGHRFEVVTGDFRHWFHQIKSPRELRRLFGLNMRGTHYMWRCLPMGWSWSPAVAQAFAWAVLLARKPDEEALFDERAFQDGHHMPSVVPTIDGRGFLVVYYDNFLLVTACAETADKFYARMQRVEADYGVAIKQDGSFKRIKHEEFCDEGLEYLGFRFRGVASATPEGNRRGRKRHSTLAGIQWFPVSLRRWKEELGENPSPRTNRQFAQWLGRMINAELMSGAPLTASSNGRTLLRSARKLGKSAAVRGWNGLWSPEPEEMEKLRVCWHKTLAMESSPFVALREEAVDPPRLWCLATDASKKGGGWILFNRASPLHDWSAVEAAAWKWSPSELALGIYEKEMMALQRGMKDHKTTVHSRDLLVVIDNAAVAWGLRSGFTNHSFGMRIITDLAPLMHDLEVVLVISADNPADCPSRAGYDDLGVRVERMQRAIRSHEKGWHWTSEPLTAWINGREEKEDDRLRHDPPGPTWTGPEDSDSEPDGSIGTERED